MTLGLFVIAIVGWATAYATRNWALREQARADKAEHLALDQARLIRALKEANAEKDAALTAVLQWESDVAALHRLSAMPANAGADCKYWRTH